MKQVILFFCVVVLMSCSARENKYREIKIFDYVDKMKGGWIGQMAGVGWGAPTEFRWKGEIMPENEMPEWTSDLINQFNQDDIYVEMTFLRTLELYGFDVTIRQAGIDFANSQYRLWHANKAGRNNLRNGIAPPWSGHPKFNAHADDIDYQIEADYAGLISPGLPQLAVDLGDKFGRIMNYGDGLYGGQFVAGMYAEAFFEKDISKIVRAGLKCIPEGSQYYQAIADVVDWHRQYPDDWQKTWSMIEEKYNDNSDYRRFSCNYADVNSNDDAKIDADFNIDAKINGAYIVMGLLYGQGDPDKTIIISARCGQDSDCNPSNAAGILFSSIGYSNLEEKFTKELNLESEFEYTDYNFPELIDVCTRLAKKAVLYYGGEVVADENGDEWFKIPVTAFVPGILEQCWEPSDAPDEVKFSTEETKLIKFAAE